MLKTVSVRVSEEETVADELDTVPYATVTRSNVQEGY
jgi:hypothetical protein